MTKTILGILGIVVVVALAVVIISKSDNTNLLGSTNSTSTGTNTTSTNTGNGGTTQPSSPSVVTNTSVTPSDTTAVVTGKVTPNGAVTSYRYEYGSTSSLGSKTANQSIGSGYIAISAPAYITGLTKNTTYYFRLVGENSYGTIVGAQYSFQTTNGVPAPAGDAPTTNTLAATGISRTSANMNGNVTPNQASTQYWFEYGNTTTLGETTDFVSVGNGAAQVAVSQSISGLNPSTQYFFRLNAQNQFGTVIGPVLNFTTDGPKAAAPSVKTNSVAQITTSTAVFRGTVNPNSAATTYWFEYSADIIVGPILLQKTEEKSAGAGASVASVSIDVTKLASNKKYSATMIARNSIGTVQGDTVTFKTE